MEIEGFKFKRFKEGWAVDSPYMGKDKAGNDKIHYKQTYYPNLRQCLDKVRDVQAKDCESVTELIELLNDAEDMDMRVLRANGLI